MNSANKDCNDMQAQQVSRRIGLMIAGAAGWTVQVQQPPARCVVVGAPHTSGWDSAADATAYAGGWPQVALDR
jgi:hypothetical protein